MQWTDEGIVLGSKRHGESNAILEVMTRAHGRHLGLVRGGASSRLRPVLQPGNRISCTWRARLDEHLGHYTLEALDARAAALLTVPHALYGMTHLATLCRLLPERDPHPQIHGALENVLDALIDPRRERSKNRPRLRLAEIGACCIAASRRTVAREAFGLTGVSGRCVCRRSFAAGHQRRLCVDWLLSGASCARAAQHQACRRARKLHCRGAARHPPASCRRLSRAG